MKNIFASAKSRKTKSLPPLGFSKEDNPKKFEPFSKERDSLGRLLTKPKIEYLKETWIAKSAFKSKECLLSQLFKDSIKTNNKSSASIVYDGKTWKEQNVITMNKDITRNVKSSRQKVSQLQLQIYVSQKKVSSPKTCRFSFETCKSKDASLVLVQTHRDETNIFSNQNLSSIKEKHLPKLFPQKEKSKSEIQIKVPEKTESDWFINKITSSDKSASNKILANNSFFRNIKTHEKEVFYVENHQIFQKKFVELREKLNNLRSSIGEISLICSKQ